jgi:hypothetical protein
LSSEFLARMGESQPISEVAISAAPDGKFAYEIR